jgi:hypothetical protein
MWRFLCVTLFLALGACESAPYRELDSFEKSPLLEGRSLVPDSPLELRGPFQSKSRGPASILKPSEPVRKPASVPQSLEPKEPSARERARMDDLKVFYSEPKIPFRRVCQIAAEGNNALAQKYVKKADFESQFLRRARRCKGANAVIIQNMFAFENGSAFADGAAIALEP